MKYFGVESSDEAGLKRLREVSPFYAVHKGMAPFLIIHGTKDNQVAYEQSPAMCDKLKKAGVACGLITDRGRRTRNGQLEGRPRCSTGSRN